MQSVMDAIRGHSQPRSDRESEGVRQDAILVRGVSPLRESRGPLIREGVPLAERPTHQQVSCMTCNMSLQEHERHQTCPVCTSWIHTHCVEVLHIGELFRADMCLSCQQDIVRRLKAISAVERRRGTTWDQDIWFAILRDLVDRDAGFGISNNRDLNDLEIKLAGAMSRGLNVYRIEVTPSNTGEDDVSHRRDSADGSNPSGLPQADSAESMQPATYLSANSSGTPIFQGQQLEGSSSRQEGAEQVPPDQRTGVREERDVRVEGPQTDQAEVQQETRAPVPSVHSERSEARERRMTDLEDSVSQIKQFLKQLSDSMQSRGSSSSDLRGPPPKAVPDSLYGFPGTTPKRPPEEYVRENLSKEAPQGQSEGIPKTPPARPAAEPKVTSPSPAFMVPEDSVWNQSYLAKALQNMKETDFAKLKFTSSANKPAEFEKWLILMETTTHAQHQEIGSYWKRVVDLADVAYHKYLKDVSYTRIAIAPEERPPSTHIEERIESRLRMILNQVIPPVIVQQCDDKPVVSCALILYRTMVHAGPASKDDCTQMMDILTKPKTYDVRKIQDAMIQFRYARARLKKYGHSEPEPRQMFETLKAAAQSLVSKDPEFSFQFRHYLMKHSSVNGLVSEQTVQQLYQMITDNARVYVDGKLEAEVRAVQQRPYDSRKRLKASDQQDADARQRCHKCGSKDHWWRDCPSTRVIPKPGQPSRSFERPLPQRHLSKPSGNVAPEGQGQIRAEKGGKGSGKKGKSEIKRKTDGKGKGKRQVRPGVRAAQDWEDYEASEQAYEEDAYDDYPPEEQEPERDICVNPIEESYEEAYVDDGQYDQGDSEPSEQGEHIVKTIMTVRHKQKEHMEKELNEALLLRATTLQVRPIGLEGDHVLLDGGASHHVYFSSEIPEGSFERQVELAHGTKTGYVKGSDITFIDKSVSEEQSKKPAIISLGRLINKGFQLEWAKTGALLVLPNKRKIQIPIQNNCPYANKEVLDIVKKIRDIEEKARQKEEYYVNLLTVSKMRIRTQDELNEHRRQGHPSYSPDCPECKKGVAKQRAHHRAATREGGELSVDIGGPYQPGTPISDQLRVGAHRRPRYMLVGAFIPFSEKDAKKRYEQEVRDRQVQGLEGPVVMEQLTKPGSQTLYFVEILAEKSEAPTAILKMINRIENMHKCKAVYRVHTDRALELTAPRPRAFLENNGIMVTSTAGYDSNANGRAERAVRFFQEKARTLLATNIRSEKFQEKLKTLWPFAVQHAGEVHIREVLGQPRCKFEFGQSILSRVNKPNTKFDPKLHKVIFLGFAPSVTNGYWVMNKKDRIELTSNVTEDPEFDRVESWIEPALKDEVRQEPELDNRTDAQREQDEEDERIMRYIEETEGDFFKPQSVPERPDEPDDPMETVSMVKLSKISENLWQEEDIKQEEIPEGLKNEIRESGAITVALKDVRQSIGKDRQEWKLALEEELQSLSDKCAFIPVTHIPRGAPVLPMKVVLTLKPQKGLPTKKKKARVCVCGNFQQKKSTDLYYTANAEVGSIRVVLAEAAQHPDYGVSSMDVATAFLNAPMSEVEEEAVFVKPPKLLEQFHLIDQNTYWRLTRAVYGLRISPRLWGKERDLQLSKMRFKIRHKVLRAMRSTIDVALWTIVEDVVEDFDQNRRTYGHLLTYVDDFLIVGPANVRKAIEEEISRLWKVRIEGQVKQFDKHNPEASLTFLSTVIRSHPTRGGFTMCQEAFIRDILKTWEMADCKPLMVPGIPTTVELPEEKDQNPDDIHRAQKIAGSLIWLSTRTRPDITYAQSRISSMMLKAPKTAVLEALRVLRYLQGTKHYVLSFKPCRNHTDVIGYTDANHSPKRSQTGAVIKLGENVVAWKSTKQTEVSLSSAESEVQAMATTAVLADYITTLRESLCLPTPTVELRCDNTAAIVLATGEGSWRTKAAANKVNFIREKVEKGKLKISYVGTKSQCADSLTKFLRGGPEQNKAREHLSLVNLEDCTNGRDAHVKSGGLSDSVQVRKVFCSLPDSFQSELSLRWKEDYQCYDKRSDSSAISVRSKSTGCFSGLHHRDLVRTGYKCYIMVKVIPLAKEEEEELPDFEAADEEPQPVLPGEAWRLSTYQEIDEDLRETVKKKGINAVDPISIALKNNPIPVKDVRTDWIKIRTNAWYGGKNIVEYLREDKFEIQLTVDVIETLKTRVSRWALIDVHDHLISITSRGDAEIKAQNDKVHGFATIKTPFGSTTPSDFDRNEDGIQDPIIGIRVFHGGPQQAINEYAYQAHYGYMHCNLAQDAHLHEGIYCWSDIEAALSSINREAGAVERQKCIGIVEGWLNYKDGNKMSLKSRSTKLRAIFAPFDEEIHLPFEMGVEDTLVFRLPPHQVGAPIRWFRQVYNIDGQKYTKAAIRIKIDSGDWPTPASESIRDHSAKVAEFNPQSLNEQDQVEQKELYIRMFEEPTEYDKTSFGLGLVTSQAIGTEGHIPLCLRYLQEAQSKKINPREGIWRLWENPKDVQRAEVLCAENKARVIEEENKKQNMVTTTSPEPIREKRTPKGLDETLDSRIQRDKSSGSYKETNDKGSQGGNRPGSSTDLPDRQHAGSEPQDLTPPRKRKAGVPDSPTSIEKLAKMHWFSYSVKMKNHEDADLPRRLCNIRGIEYLELKDLLVGLTFDMEDYSPILQHQSDGSLKYILVVPYNSKWLPRDHKGHDRPEGMKISFNPVITWIEDRWMLVRRMAGDYFCQVLFYHVCTFIWKKNDLTDEEVHVRQDSLLKSVFHIKELEQYKAGLRNPIRTKTWKGRTVYLNKKLMSELVSETCLLGPVAAMYGREFQQFLITRQGETKIAVEEVEYSVNCGRASLSQRKVDELLQTDTQNHTWKDRSSPPQPPWVEPQRYSYASYQRQGQERNTYEDRFRNTDIRERPDYDRLRQQQDYLRRQERIRDYDDRAKRKPYHGYYRRESSDEDEVTPRYIRYPSLDRQPETRRPRHYDRDQKRESRGYHKDDWYNHGLWY